MKKALLLLIFLTNVVTANWEHDNISQAVFSESVEDRVPTNVITEAQNNIGKVYFFTNIRNLTGDTITHRWIYKDKVKAEVSFKIKAKRWRVWSSKNIYHTWTGQWRVEVVDKNNQILINKTIMINN